MRVFILFFSIILFSIKIYSQGCCAGGGGSPIAGGATQGVLQAGQVEISSNFQYISSDKFKTGDKFTPKLFDKYNSNYNYSKIAYGVTKDFTISIESGYFFNKIQTGFYDAVLSKSEKIESSGIADLIIFPKFDIVNRVTEKKRFEITLGLGYKIPLGKHNDSTLVYTNPISGQQIFTASPPLVQPTNGSNDIILYAFFFKGFTQKNFRVFANTIYIRRGWNSLGEKFGDYASVGLFAGKTIFNNFGITLQIKGEQIGKLEAAENLDLLALYNVNSTSTGSEKITFVPQINFNYKSLTFYGLYELPLYENVYGNQLASQHQFIFGVAYRFFVKAPTCEIPSDAKSYYACTMKCEGGGSYEPGKCKICGMELEKVK